STFEGSAPSGLSPVRRIQASCTGKAGQDSFFFTAEGLEQPGPGQEPEAVARPAAQSQQLGGLLVLGTRGVAEGWQGGRLGVVLLQLLQRLVDGQQFVRPVVHRKEALVECLAPGPAASLPPPFAARPFDQDAAHGLAGGGEEVAAAAPVLVGAATDQSQV